MAESATTRNDDFLLISVIKRLPALVLLALLAVVLAGCMIGSIGQPLGVAYPEGCGEFNLPRDRCEAIVAGLAQQSDIDFDEIAVIQLVGPHECHPPDKCDAAREAFVLGVRFTYWSGSTAETFLWCGPLNQGDLLCQE